MIKTRDGATVIQRMTSPSMSVPFLLNPLLRDNRDLVAWLSGSQGARIASFTLVTPPSCQWLYRPAYRYHLRPFHESTEIDVPAYKF